MLAPRHILVIRFSAMGDVAMTVPVVKQVLLQYPGVKITVVSNAFLQPLYAPLRDVTFFPAFLKTQHKGAKGMYRLFRELLAANKYDAVVDLHGVLRSHLLAGLFRLKGIRTASINKGRGSKHKLTRKTEKVMVALPAMHLRYAEVFRAVGLPVHLDLKSRVYPRQDLPSSLATVFSQQQQVIGIAPFAQYAEKTYPLNQMKQVVAQLVEANICVLLFGGGNQEAAILADWEQSIPGAVNLAGKHPLGDELAMISNLDLMVSMDSANMHLASLFDIEVVSIWGATHPFAGFAGWGQQPHNFLQTALYCRPCSVFGNKPCYRGDLACLRSLPGESIVLHIRAALAKKKDTTGPG